MPGNIDISSACLCLKHFTKEDIQIIGNPHLLIPPQLSYILITSCIQEFWDYVQSKLLYGLRSKHKDKQPDTQSIHFGKASVHLNKQFKHLNKLSKLPNIV